MAALAQPDLMETAIRQRLASVVMPEGIKLKRIDFRNNSNGIPSVFVVYAISEISQSDEERSKDLLALMHATVRPLWKLDLPLIPYTEFEVG